MVTKNKKIKNPLKQLDQFQYNLTKLLLIQITEFFSHCDSKSNKYMYAIFQMMWYSFTGKVLNYNCGINLIDNILSNYCLNLGQSNKL